MQRNMCLYSETNGCAPVPKMTTCVGIADSTCAVCIQLILLFVQKKSLRTGAILNMLWALHKGIQQLSEYYKIKCPFIEHYIHPNPGHRMSMKATLTLFTGSCGSRKESRPFSHKMTSLWFIDCSC